MKKFKLNIIIIAAAVFLISMGLLGYFRHKAKSYEKVPEIVNELIVPYRQALSNGNYQYAYNKFTSARYKNEYSYYEFLDAQIYNFSTFGAIESIEPVSGIFIKESLSNNPWDPGNKSWVYKGTLVYEGSNPGDKGKPITARIVMDVIVENGEYRIYDTYNSFVSIGSVKPQIF